jgi:hypothetical protein
MDSSQTKDIDRFIQDQFDTNNCRCQDSDKECLCTMFGLWNADHPIVPDLDSFDDNQGIDYNDTKLGVFNATFQNYFHYQGLKTRIYNGTIFSIVLHEDHTNGIDTVQCYGEKCRNRRYSKWCITCYGNPDDKLTNLEAYIMMKRNADAPTTLPYCQVGSISVSHMLPTIDVLKTRFVHITKLIERDINIIISTQDELDELNSSLQDAQSALALSSNATLDFLQKTVDKIKQDIDDTRQYKEQIIVLLKTVLKKFNFDENDPIADMKKQFADYDTLLQMLGQRDKLKQRDALILKTQDIDKQQNYFDQKIVELQDTILCLQKDKQFLVQQKAAIELDLLSDDSDDLQNVASRFLSSLKL